MVVNSRICWLHTWILKDISAYDLPHSQMPKDPIFNSPICTLQLSQMSFDIFGVDMVSNKVMKGARNKVKVLIEVNLFHSLFPLFQAV